jgi:hypothetical protein
MYSVHHLPQKATHLAELHVHAILVVNFALLIREIRVFLQLVRASSVRETATNQS